MVARGRRAWSLQLERYGGAAIRIATHVIAVRIPVAQYPALTLAPVDDVDMPARPVRMAVDQTSAVGIAKRLLHRARIYVHDFGALVLLCAFALTPQSRKMGMASGERLRP